MQPFCRPVSISLSASNGQVESHLTRDPETSLLHEATFLLCIMSLPRAGEKALSRDKLCAGKLIIYALNYVRNETCQ